MIYLVNFSNRKKMEGKIEIPENFNTDVLDIIFSYALERKGIKTTVLEACRKGDLNLFLRLMNVMPIDKRDPGYTEAAFRGGNCRIVKILLSKGFRINPKNVGRHLSSVFKHQSIDLLMIIEKFLINHHFEKETNRNVFTDKEFVRYVFRSLLQHQKDNIIFSMLEKGNFEMFMFASKLNTYIPVFLFKKILSLDLDVGLPIFEGLVGQGKLPNILSVVRWMKPEHISVLLRIGFDKHKTCDSYLGEVSSIQGAQMFVDASALLTSNSLAEQLGKLARNSRRDATICDFFFKCGCPVTKTKRIIHAIASGNSFRAVSWLFEHGIEFRDDTQEEFEVTKYTLQNLVYEKRFRILDYVIEKCQHLERIGPLIPEIRNFESGGGEFTRFVRKSIQDW